MSFLAGKFYFLLCNPQSSGPRSPSLPPLLYPDEMFLVSHAILFRSSRAVVFLSPHDLERSVRILWSMKVLYLKASPSLPVLPPQSFLLPFPSLSTPFYAYFLPGLRCCLTLIMLPLKINRVPFTESTLPFFNTTSDSPLIIVVFQIRG